jgi:hypothetical protein
MIFKKNCRQLEKSAEHRTTPSFSPWWITCTKKARGAKRGVRAKLVPRSELCERLKRTASQFSTPSNDTAISLSVHSHGSSPIIKEDRNQLEKTEQRIPESFSPWWIRCTNKFRRAKRGVRAKLVPRSELCERLKQSASHVLRQNRIWIHNRSFRGGSDVLTNPEGRSASEARVPKRALCKTETERIACSQTEPHMEFRRWSEKGPHHRSLNTF